MENILIEMMAEFIELNDEEKRGIMDAFPIRPYPAGTDLVKEGQITKDAFLVIKGCIRKYYYDDGEDVTLDFFTEYQSALNFESTATDTASKYYLTCVEDCILAVINADKETELYRKFPKFGEVCRVELEKMLGASHDALINFKKSTPQERYEDLLKERPQLIHRVPQYQLASYLGVKPETLSRIRKRISTKH